MPDNAEFEFSIDWKIPYQERYDRIDPADNVSVGFSVTCSKHKKGHTAKNVRLTLELPGLRYGGEGSGELADASEEHRYFGLQTVAGILKKGKKQEETKTAKYYDQLGPSGQDFTSAASHNAIVYDLGDFVGGRVVEGVIVLKTGNCLGSPNALEGQYSIPCFIEYQAIPNEADLEFDYMPVSNLDFTIEGN